MIDYNSYLSLLPMLFIGLGTRLDRVAVEGKKPVLSFSSVSPELLSKGVQVGQTNILPIRRV